MNLEPVLQALEIKSNDVNVSHMHVTYIDQPMCYCLIWRFNPRPVLTVSPRVLCG